MRMMPELRKQGQRAHSAEKARDTTRDDENMTCVTESHDVQ